MNKKQILKATGLSEKEFYKLYPTQEHFHKDMHKYDLGGMINGAQAGSQMGAGFGMYGKIIGSVLGAAGGQVGDILGQNRELAGYDQMVNQKQLAFGGNMTESINAGGTHEENPNEGVNIGNKGLVEEGEVKFNYKDKTGDNSYIFSKRLGFANKAKSIMKKFDIRDNDKMATEAKEQRLKGLMNNQEVVRSSMFNNQFKKAFGGGLKKYSGVGNFANGWKNTKKSGGFDPNTFNINTATNPTLVDPNQVAKETFTTNPYSDQKQLNLTTPETVNTVSKDNGYNNQLNKLGQYGQFAGALSKLATAASGPDAVNLQRMKNHNMSSLPEEIKASNEIGNIFSGLNTDIRNNSGSNAGTYLANRIASANNQADKTGQALSGIRSKFNEFNTRNNMAVDQFNTQTSNTEDDLRTREKDAVRTLMMDAASQAGNVTGNISRDNTANEQQNNILGLLQTQDFDLEQDPKTGKFKISSKYKKGFGGFIYKSKLKSKKK